MKNLFILTKNTIKAICNNINTIIVVSIIIAIIVLTTIFNIAIIIDNNIPTYVAIYLLFFIDLFILTLIIELNSETISFYIAKRRGRKVSNYLNQKGYNTYIDSENFLMLESDNLTNRKQKAIRRLCYFNNTDFDTYYINN
mgnify:CR=1 FL=1